MGSNGGNLIRLEEINRIRSKLEKDIDARKTLSARYRKFYNTLHGISIGSSSINAAIAGATIAVLQPKPNTIIMINKKWSCYPNGCYPNGQQMSL